MGNRCRGGAGEKKLCRLRTIKTGLFKMSSARRNSRRPAVQEPGSQQRHGRDNPYRYAGGSKQDGIELRGAFLDVAKSGDGGGQTQEEKEEVHVHSLEFED